MSKLPCPQQHIAQVPEADRDKCVPYTTLEWSALEEPPHCAGPWPCPSLAAEEHHCLPKWFTRGWQERDYALLYGELVGVKLPLCSAHHRDCTENRAMMVYTPESGFVWTWLTEGEPRDPRALDDVPALVEEADPSPSVSPGDTRLTGVGEDRSLGADKSPPASEPDLLAGGSSSPIPVSPGQSCPTCQRRIPYPKVESSPTSAVWSMRMPADAKEDFRGIVDALAAHLGAGEERYGAYKAMLTAAYWALQVAPERVLSEIGERVA